MKTLLYWVVDQIARVHDWILTLNNRFPTVLTDKQLHFLVIGLLGMGLFFFFHWIFKLLIRSGHEIVISWFYVFTVILVITFAIEIGQKATGTGAMEFADIVFGVFGFLFLFTVFALVRWLVIRISRYVKSRKARHG